MRGLRAWVVRLAGVFGGGRRDRDIAAELAAHRDELADEYMRSGMTADDARRRAAAAFGSVLSASDAYRDRRGLPSLEGMLRDSRMAVRSLARTPVLSASMILVLGLGIGLATAIVAVFHAVVWDTLPVPSPQAVVRVTQHFAGQVDRRAQGNRTRFSYPELEAYRATTRTLAALAGSVDVTANWRYESGVRRLHGMLVTAGYFDVLPVTPALGRLLGAADARQSVVVISHRLWAADFGSRPDAIGQTMRIDGSTYAIVGVAPPSFSFSGSDQPTSSFWLPLEARYAALGELAFLQESNVSWLQVFGRLADGVALGVARAEAATIAAAFDRDYSGRRTTIDVSRASRIDRAGFQTAIFTASGVLAVFLGVLFLICGSNAAALLLARGASRQKEIAVRLALGASRGRVVRQLAAELVIIAAASALLGVGIAVASLQGLAGLVPMGDILLSIQPDTRVFGFAFATALVVTALFGLAPARQALSVDCLAELKGEASLWGRQVSGIRLRRALIAIQVAVSVPLLVVAALLGRSVSQAWRSDPGYATRSLYAVHTDTVDSVSSRALADSFAAIPAVRVVGRALVAPFFGSGFSSAGLEAGRLEPTRFNLVDDQFFAALGVPMAAGRGLLPGERDAIIVNARLARRFWPNDADAIGQLLFVPVPKERNAPPQPMRVVGVTPTLQTVTIGVPDEPTYYGPLPDSGSSGIWTLVRTDAGTPVESAILDVVRSAYPDVQTSVTELDVRLLAMTRPSRIGVIVAGSIGLLALVVAAIGVHGVIAYTVAGRARDIGIYQALGAAPRQVLSLILGWTLRGVAIGAAGAVLVLALAGFVFSGPLRPLFNGLSPLDLPSFAIGLAVLSVVIGAAAYLPARRALGMTPLAALRHD